jgi:fumarate hydratase subunit alpha
MRQIGETMRIIKAQDITGATARLCAEACRVLPRDVKERLAHCAENEPWPAAKDTLLKLQENYLLAEKLEMPVCQDTGMACVFVELGQDAHIAGSLAEAVDEGVRRGYTEGFLRKSIVADPLNRNNTGDNTPAMLYLELVPGDSAKITVAPKGCGSENKSRVKMLDPSQGEQGVVDFVLETVELAGASACPPFVIGVGIGGTFDKAALLAKKALLRPLGQHNPQEYYAALEADLLARVNWLGIGPQGFGGLSTALGVAVEAMATHIASLPCAVNINCHAARHASEVL